MPTVSNGLTIAFRSTCTYGGTLCINPPHGALYPPLPPPPPPHTPPTTPPPKKKTATTTPTLVATENEMPTVSNGLTIAFRSTCTYGGTLCINPPHGEAVAVIVAGAVD